MGGQVFRIDREGPLELRSGMAQEVFLFLRISSLHLGPFEVSLTKFVDDLIVLAEVEPARVQFRITIFKDAAKFLDGLVKEAVLFIHQAVEPRHGPLWRGRAEFDGTLEG